MKLNLFLVLCFTGFVPVAVFIVQTVPHRYELSTSILSWSNAQIYCRATYTDLAVILSDTDWLRLNYVQNKNSLIRNNWVGLYNDFESWRWSLNDLPLKNVSYRNWVPGDPNNLNAKESCGAANVYGQWTDECCTATRPFICYNANYSGASCFIGYTTAMTWPAAQTFCRQEHTDLASALHTTDSTYISKICVVQGNSWIGLYRDTWKWLDGSKAENLQWGPGQPNNYLGNQNCAIVSRGVFDDISCTDLHYFFCHTDFPTRSQIIKLELTSDESLFDPAVQSLILEQIKLKLKKNGVLLESVVVKLRVQPNGEIFQRKRKHDL